MLAFIVVLTESRLLTCGTVRWCTEWPRVGMDLPKVVRRLAGEAQGEDDGYVSDGKEHVCNHHARPKEF